jgi:hypothetical protein
MVDEFDLDTWLEDYEPVIVEAKVVQKAALISEHTRLQIAVVEAHQAAGDVMHDPTASGLVDELRAVEEKIAASVKTFRFQGIGHEPWQDLKRKYPPTPEQREAGDDVNLTRWSPAVVAACSLDPKVTVPQAETMMRKLPPGEFDKLLIAVREANQEVVGAPKSALVAHIDRSRRNGDWLTTGLPAGSRVDDSSGTLADPSPESPETPTDG